MTAVKLAPPEDSEKIRVRLEEWRIELHPDGSYQRWMAEQVVAASVRVDRCRTQEDAWRYRQASRARGAWDIDRRAEVEQLAEGLERRPARIAAQLLQSLHGCDWLLTHWRVLAAVIRDGQGTAGGPRPLAEEHRWLAFDLLGLAPERRLGTTPLDLPAGTDGDDAALAAHQARTIADQIAELERHRIEGLAEADAIDQSAVMLGIGTGVDPTLRLIRRYEAAAHRERRRAMDELRRTQREHPNRELRRIEARCDDGPALAPCEAIAPIEAEAEETGSGPIVPAVPVEAASPLVMAPALAANVANPRPATPPSPATFDPPPPVRPITLSELYPAAPPLNRRARLARAREAAHRS